MESMCRGNPQQGWRQRLKVRDKDSVLGREAALSKFHLLRSQRHQGWGLLEPGA